jgi:hypothetical protein
MITLQAYIDALAVTGKVLCNPHLRLGAIIECGTWRGGMAAGMIETCGFGRQYYFFDSFAGLPPAQELDGNSAFQWQADETSPNFHDNCSASIEEFYETIRMTKCPPQNVHVYKGFFEDTLPRFDCPPIAVLRLDGDWFASTMICLDALWDRVLPGGVVLIDDYYAWEGCAKAVHTFLAKRMAPERIYQGLVRNTAFIIKGPDIT